MIFKKSGKNDQKHYKMMKNNLKMNKNKSKIAKK